MEISELYFSKRRLVPCPELSRLQLFMSSRISWDLLLFLFLLRCLSTTPWRCFYAWLFQNRVIFFITSRSGCWGPAIITDDFSESKVAWIKSSWRKRPIPFSSGYRMMKQYYVTLLSPCIPPYRTVTRTVAGTKKQGVTRRGLHAIRLSWQHVSLLLI